jgi:predicted nuclease with TOPRIM domain
LQKAETGNTKRDLLAQRSKNRELFTQNKDLKDRILELEKENETFKDKTKTLRKENKELKQDFDLKKKQSFRSLEAESKEFENKLREEIQQRVNYFNPIILFSNKKHKIGLRIEHNLNKLLKT